MYWYTNITKEKGKSYFIGYPTMHSPGHPNAPPRHFLPSHLLAPLHRLPPQRPTSRLPCTACPPPMPIIGPPLMLYHARARA